MTTPNPFQQPGKSGEFFSPKHHPEWLDRLFIFYPDSSTMRTFKEEEGPKEFVTADVAIVDLADPQTGQPVELKGVSIGGVSLVPALNRDRIGTKVLARLRRGAPKGGNDGAFYLDAESLTPQDIATATAYDASRTAQQFNRPTVQQTPAAAPPQQYGQQPAQAPYGGAPAPQQAQPQYASQQLPYDPWQGTQAAAPAGPPQGQWGQPPAGQGQAPAAAPQGASAPGAAPQWGNPAASPQAAPAPTPPASASAVDPALTGFLQSKQVPTAGMGQGQMLMIARLYEDCPPQFLQ
ncbi:hypothetical protein DEJ49_33180 [Streptomyces venezuelae]|uniref:Uncharacterized protein n=1 Tax=Streptomyces venezuelae TaxID=54571 RepID=A0A5P2CQM0_STRVZ|nr:hypothetical protein [Streptomyces venezuelae]QES45196.1 hypothetical protein DEJ49_33180 [Streptomyces venezuelae]